MSATTAAKKTAAAKKPAAAKSTAAKATATKPTAATIPATPAATAAPAPVTEKAKGAALKMKDLIEQVTEASGGKKKGVKEIVEATLTALGNALAKGDAINLPGFGRAKVAHAEDKGAGKPMTIKLKSQGAAKVKTPRTKPLAEDDE